MPKNKEDDAPIPEEIKVDRTGTKRLKVASASDEDIRKAPKPTVVSDRSAWTETNKLDFEVSKMAGLSDAEAEAKINKKREKLGKIQNGTKTAVQGPSKGGVQRSTPKASAETTNSAPRAIQRSQGQGGGSAPATSRPSGVSNSSPSKPAASPRSGTSSPVPLEKSGSGSKAGPPKKSPGRDFVGPKVPASVPSIKPNVGMQKADGPINFDGPKKNKPSYVTNEENKIKSELRRATSRPSTTSEEDTRSARWKAKYEKPMTEQAKSFGKFMSTPLKGAAGNPMKAAFGGKSKAGGKKRPPSSGNRTRRGND